MLTDKNRYSIPILAKGMALLEEISRNPQGLTLTELTSILNAPKTSLYRILCSLAEMGYLRRDDRTARFSMTHKIFGMAISSIGSPSLLEYAYDPMRRLRDELLETVVVGTLTENQVVILDQIIGIHHFCFTVKPGMNVCLHASAPGKAIAAYMEPDELRRLLDKIVYTRYNDNTIASEAEFIAALDEVRQRGYAIDRGEEIAGVRCIGAPVFNRYSKAVAAVWITGPEGRIGDDVTASHGEAIMRCAAEISHKLGYMNRPHHNTQP